jgi:hypothetical protein
LRDGDNRKSNQQTRIRLIGFLVEASSNTTPECIFRSLIVIWLELHSFDHSSCSVIVLFCSLIAVPTSFTLVLQLLTSAKEFVNLCFFAIHLLVSMFFASNYCPDFMLIGITSQ